MNIISNLIFHCNNCDANRTFVTIRENTAAAPSRPSSLLNAKCTFKGHKGRHTQIFGGSKSAAHDRRSTSNDLATTLGLGQTVITSPIFKLRSVIDYHNKRGSTVNFCMSDISKAFDKVNHYCIFIKLMNRSVPVVLLKELINWYDKCAVFVRWNNALSTCFYLMCDVR